MYRTKAILFILILFNATALFASNDTRAIIRQQESIAKRTALVIGNSNYKTSPLKNPVNDARDLTAALEQAGFVVYLVTNGDQRKMEDSIRNFGAKLQAGGTGLFYFAGHGIQYQGRNYLIPVGARIEDETDVKYEAVDASRVLSKMELAGNEVNIVVLDACRNNPFARSFRSADQGLARMDAPTGSLVAYATAPGSVAADGKGRNGIYTKYFLQYMEQPGLTIEQLFKKVRKAVLSETGRKQTPWESSSLTGNFYFYGSSGVANLLTESQVVIPAAPVNTINAEEELWLEVKSSTKVEEFQIYLDAYPNGRFAQIAIIKMRRIKETANHSTLSIVSTPANANIRILNIKNKYNPKMSLNPGRYHIEVSKNGYQTVRKWISLPSSEDMNYPVLLEPQQAAVASEDINHPVMLEPEQAAIAIDPDIISATISFSPTQKEIQKRGHLNCGVSTGLPGFSIPDKNGQWNGFDTDTCRALAAAVLGDIKKVKYIPLNPKECFTALQSGEVDILIRGLSWTRERDNDMGLQFAGTNIYEGQGFMVNKILGVKSTAELDGADVCTLAGDDASNVGNYFRKKRMRFKTIVYKQFDDMAIAYDNGRCDVITNNIFSLAQLRLVLKTPDRHEILADAIHIGRIGPYVREDDQGWKDIVKWTLYALIKTEEVDINQGNVDRKRKLIRSFIPQLSPALKGDWAYQIIKQVGNYGEIFERNLGMRSQIRLPRSLSALKSKGGMMEAIAPAY